MAGETTQAIMDAAERRIRSSGCGGFSFRDLASDVGIKSASVHYHFPTKDMLVAAVIRRYNDRILQSVEAEVASGLGVVDAWRAVFRSAVTQDGRMCLCGSLAVVVADLTPDVVAEVRRFFERAVENLVVGGLSHTAATQVLAVLEGAVLIASMQQDVTLFDAAAQVLSNH